VVAKRQMTPNDSTRWIEACTRFDLRSAADLR
jgi:hypothetical protein